MDTSTYTRLTATVADVVETAGGELLRIEITPAADGSGRWLALIDTYTAGQEQTYRVLTPAPADAPAWARQYDRWTTEIRVDEAGGRWMQLDYDVTGGAYDEPADEHGNDPAHARAVAAGIAEIAEQEAADWPAEELTELQWNRLAEAEAPLYGPNSGTYAWTDVIGPGDSTLARTLWEQASSSVDLTMFEDAANPTDAEQTEIARRVAYALATLAFGPEFVREEAHR